MNTPRRIILTTAAALTLLSAGAQTAKRITATKANEYALVYSLPKTMIDVTVEAQITVRKPGEFYKYAPKYLNINNPITKESHSATLLSASVSTHGIQDQDEVYSIQFKPGNPVTVMLDAAGIPLAINTEEVFKRDLRALPEAHKAAPTPLETPAARQVISEEMLQSQSTAKKAELAAQAIFAIRQTRGELISGQADTMPPDGESLQLMLDNLQAQEDALMAMFVGTTSVSTQVETFTVDPAAVEAEDKGRVIVCRISAVDGIVDSGDLSGDPVYLDMSVTARGELPVNEKGQQLTFPRNGVPYRIPGQMEASVVYDGKTVATDRLDIAQLGVIYGLAPNSFTDRKAPVFVIYNPATGAIARQGAATQ